MTVELAWRGPVANAELNALHAEGFGQPLLDEDWEDQLARHSLGWVVARADDQLVGFVNVAWDGGGPALVPAAGPSRNRPTPLTSLAVAQWPRRHSLAARGRASTG